MTGDSIKVILLQDIKSLFEVKSNDDSVMYSKSVGLSKLNKEMLSHCFGCNKIDHIQQKKIDQKI